jgi:hypothetical protein
VTRGELLVVINATMAATRGGVFIRLWTEYGNHDPFFPSRSRQKLDNEEDGTQHMRAAIE